MQTCHQKFNLEEMWTKTFQRGVTLFSKKSSQSFWFHSCLSVVHRMCRSLLKCSLLPGYVHTCAALKLTVCYRHGMGRNMYLTIYYNHLFSEILKSNNMSLVNFQLLVLYFLSSLSSGNANDCKLSPHWLSRGRDMKSPNQPQNQDV